MTYTVGIEPLEIHTKGIGTTSSRCQTPQRNTTSQCSVLKGGILLESRLLLKKATG